MGIKRKEFFTEELTTEFEFLIAEPTLTVADYEGGCKFNMFIKLKSEEIVFKRKVYDILDMISDLGGLSGGLIQILSFILSIYDSNMLEYSLLKNDFEFRARSNPSFKFASIDKTYLDTIQK